MLNQINKRKQAMTAEISLKFISFGYNILQIKKNTFCHTDDHNLLKKYTTFNEVNKQYYEFWYFFIIT